MKMKKEMARRKQEICLQDFSYTKSNSLSRKVNYVLHVSFYLSLDVVLWNFLLSRPTDLLLLVRWIESSHGTTLLVVKDGGARWKENISLIAFHLVLTGKFILCLSIGECLEAESKEGWLCHIFEGY